MNKNQILEELKIKSTMFYNNLQTQAQDFTREVLYLYQTDQNKINDDLQAQISQLEGKKEVIGQKKQEHQDCFNHKKYEIQKQADFLNIEDKNLNKDFDFLKKDIVNKIELQWLILYTTILKISNIKRAKDLSIKKKILRTQIEDLQQKNKLYRDIFGLEFQKINQNQFRIDFPDFKSYVEFKLENEEFIIPVISVDYDHELEELNVNEKLGIFISRLSEFLLTYN